MANDDFTETLIILQNILLETNKKWREEVTEISSIRIQRPR